MSTAHKAARFAISTWSVRRSLAATFPDRPEEPSDGSGWTGLVALRERLLALPGEAARRGIGRLEFCHFHLSRHDRGFLGALREAMRDAGIVAQSLLIDDGDLSNAASHGRDLAWIASWLEAAAELGVEQARVIAGKQQPGPQTLALAIRGLGEAARLGRGVGVPVITENWFDLLASPAEVTHVLDGLAGTVGFLADTGNWKGADKYRHLAAIFGRAQYCHARCSIDAAYRLDEADFGLSLAAAERVGYAGPYTLIYDGQLDDEWRGLEKMRNVVEGRIGKAA
jgi:hypothetical protein